MAVCGTPLAVARKPAGLPYDHRWDGTSTLKPPVVSLGAEIERRREQKRAWAAAELARCLENRLCFKCREDLPEGYEYRNCTKCRPAPKPPKPQTERNRIRQEKLKARRAALAANQNHDDTVTAKENNGPSDE